MSPKVCYLIGYFVSMFSLYKLLFTNDDNVIFPYTFGWFGALIGNIVGLLDYYTRKECTIVSFIFMVLIGTGALLELL